MSRKPFSLSAALSKNDPKKQTSLMAFMAKKEKTALESNLTESIDVRDGLNPVAGPDEEAKLRSPSIFKPKFPKAKQSSTVELITLKTKVKASQKIKNNYSDRVADKVDQMDEYDLLVTKYCTEASKIAMNLELDLENDSRYQQATKKLEENLAKISPAKKATDQDGASKIGKFQYKVPKAASLLSGLSEPLKKPINLNKTPLTYDDDPFETKHDKPSSSTPIGSTSFSFIQKKSSEAAKGEQSTSQRSLFKTKLPSRLQVNKIISPKTDAASLSEKKINNQNNSPLTKAAVEKPNKPNIHKPPTTPESISTYLDRLFSSTKKNTSVNFDPALDDYMVDILNSPSFKFNGGSKAELKKNSQSLQDTYKSLLEKFYSICDQLPTECFGSVQGFRMDTFSKLKSLVENVKGKIRVNEKALENFKTHSVTGSRKSRSKSNGFDDYDAMCPSSSIKDTVLNDVNFVEQENDFVDSTLPGETPKESAASQSGAFVFKKPIFGTMLNSSDSTALSEVKENGNRSREDDEDDIESIMNNIREAELIDTGRSNQTNLSSIDLVTPESSFRRPEPRITFSAQETSLRNTQFIENVDTQLDDDGWQVYDASQFENSDVISITDASEGLPSTSSNQCNQSKSDASLCRLLDDVDSQVSTASSYQPRAQNSLGNFHSGVRNDGLSGEFDGMNHPHSEQMKIVFHETFGLRSYRPNQLQVINATLLGHDCFVLMPTGGGKSLCYQLPALLTEGVTIVVSPLKSLILDQVNKLSSLDIPAAHLSGDVSYADQQKIYNDLQSSRPVLKLLYVTPEKISSSGRFQNVLTGLFRMKQMARFVIDEAHCVSAWGHDFRPDYKKLSVLREQFPSVPIMALTATANPRVRIDVLKQLRLTRNTKWFLCSFNRPNLKYIIRPKQGAATKAEIIELIKKKFPRASGIVYCLSKKDCDQLASEMQRAGIAAKSYHAGLSDLQRESNQKDWITDKTKVVCATIAFGMGIDKPDVRYVIHHSMPKSIEGYYQEAGRAGRDGEPSSCILFYNYSDMLRYRKMMDHGKSIPFEAKQVHLHNLFRMVNYCENVTDCRRALQLDYFAEHFTREQCLENRATACDNCLMQGEYKTVDVTDDCIAIVKSVRDLCACASRFTLLHLAEVFKGSEQKKVIDNNHHRTPYHGRLKSWDRSDIQRLMHKLVIEDYLKEDLIFSNDIPQAYIKIGSKIEKLMNREVRINFSTKEKTTTKKIQQIAVGNEAKLDSQSKTQLKELQERCYNDLLDICRALAAQKNVTLASVMNMQALKAMAERLPETQAEMLALPHVTKANFEKYGQQLLEITQNYAAEKLCLMLDVEDDSSDSENSDTTDWGRLAREASVSNSAGASGSKRRRSWGSGGRGAKRFRKGRTKSKARAKTTSTRGRGASSSKTAAKSATRGARSGSSGFGLLPLPGNR
ncbi:recQ-like DNA helicase Blm isoform X2 [Ochlerotatus camptorhynchus]|uniref:recQ-like DNA helicase Blm isoform X2 n=1 Tax=Ochlerotatus camptorhynchus TaxID=644619 RepID=UPI0031CF6A76